METKELFAESGGHKYRLMTLPDFRRFRDLAFSSEGWSTHFSDSKLTVQSKPPPDKSTGLNIIRAKRVMPTVPPQVLYDQLQDAKYRATWDENMLEGYNIVVLDAHNDVGYYAAKFPVFLSNRDFCNQRSWMEFTNGDYVIFNHSEPHNDCPPKKGFVRARSILTGYFIQPHESGGNLLTYVTHSDPCGSIPHSIINFVMSKGATVILDKCEKYSLSYPEWTRQNYPPGHVFPWRTPKMDWDSTYLYPEDAEKAAAEKSEEPPATNELEPAAAVNDAPNVAGEKRVDTVNMTAPTLSYAPVAPPNEGDNLALQQYRATMQDAMNTIDRSFVREGHIPTTSEYIIRLKMHARRHPADNVTFTL
ncbi:hypothetical protein STCU_01856 [Strigomonas culicis]|uniref:START domain-containing protein 10 n=1 Tax=Strigomonas culicis TaxID=28005 RepID=S9WCV7_9TRYP|nr:hypothetical protein STCU_01856 [Strigomonas culicis]|eukprot:EPY33910.1 hypothetical protein STCU_01856 [Strigomonas culicis]